MVRQNKNNRISRDPDLSLSTAVTVPTKSRLNQLAVFDKNESCLGYNQLPILADHTMSQAHSKPTSLDNLFRTKMTTSQAMTAMKSLPNAVREAKMPIAVEHT
jgi:hypothetical protein